MTHSPALPATAVTTQELAHRLGVIMAGLAALVAWRFLRLPRLVGLIGPLWARLTRAARRFDRLVTRPARLLPARLRHDRSRHDRSAETRAPALPQGRAWLVRELGYEAAGFGCQLEALLNEPAMQALLATCPGAGRILAPLCRMLGVPAGLVARPAPTIAATEAAPVAMRSVWTPVETDFGVGWEGRSAVRPKPE